ncbi:hypothetical protein RND61_09945 [Streptomyces sp. TRM76323]|uniref:Uncharacterized protein n=1 Tax=Streptomyces tamarix TaxID=3078565 RepID=A0ABU3QHZ5_9ACTN|nr:hypothetical protein [Streptomyces tamarix]MDT9682388.1 hypothetical protein [Streptomyces tamarix]
MTVDSSTKSEGTEPLMTTETVEVGFGRNRAGAADVPLPHTAAVDALVAARPEVDWEGLRHSTGWAAGPGGRRSAP